MLTEIRLEFDGRSPVRYRWAATLITAAVVVLALGQLFAWTWGSVR